MKSKNSQELIRSAKQVEPLKSQKHYDDTQRLVCRICLKEYKHLGSHVAKAHKITAKEYKRMFDLDLNLPLITDAIREKKQDRFEEDREKYLKNLRTKNARKNCFKKGHSQKRTYFSEISRTRALTNLELMNNLEKRRGPCPICNAITNHVESHLYNKHGLLVRDRDKFYS